MKTAGVELRSGRVLVEAPAAEGSLDGWRVRVAPACDPLGEHGLVVGDEGVALAVPRGLWPDRRCSPRHPPHFKASFHDILTKTSLTNIKSKTTLQSLVS